MIICHQVMCLLLCCKEDQILMILMILSSKIQIKLPRIYLGIFYSSRYDFSRSDSDTTSQQALVR